nr:hypothetical protein BaRGS_003688 [Batillaria attramentaria]
MAACMRDRDVSQLKRGAVVDVDEAQARLMLVERRWDTLRDTAREIRSELDRQDNVDANLTDLTIVMKEELESQQELGNTLVANLNKLTSENNQLRKDFTDQTSKFMSEDNATKEELERHREADKDIRDEIGEMRSSDTNLQDELRQLEDADISLNARVDSLTVRADSLTSRADLLTSEDMAMKKELERQRADNKKLREDLDALAKQIDEFSTTVLQDLEYRF